MAPSHTLISIIKSKHSDVMRTRRCVANETLRITPYIGRPASISSSTSTSRASQHPFTPSQLHPACLPSKSSITKTAPHTPPRTVRPFASLMPPSALASMVPCCSRVCCNHCPSSSPPYASKDFHHIDLLAHFDRERIPERVVRISFYSENGHP